MPNSDREVSLKLSTSTSGEESLRAVSEDLKRLSTEGGAAAPQFEELANKLDDLSNQRALIDSFVKLKQCTIENEEALRGATIATAEAVRALRDRQSALSSSAAAESAANQRLTEAKAQLNDNKTALEAARKELTEYQAANKLAAGSIDGIASAIAFAKDSVRQYRDAVRESKSEVAAMSSEQRAASSAAREAAADVRTAARGFDEARLSAGEAKSAYDDSSVSLQRLRAELTQVGIQTSALSAHDAQLRTQMQQLSAEAIQLTQKMRSGTEESDRLSKSLSDAFAVTGVRSASMLNAEITRIDQALVRLANDSRVSGEEFNRAWTSGQAKMAALRTELEGAQNGAAALGSGMEAAAAGTSKLASFASAAAGQLAALAVPLAGLFAAQKFVEINAQIDSANRTLTQLTGSAELAAKELEYLKATSNKLGLELGEATKSYLSLTAATKGTRLEGAQTKEVFEAIAGAMGKLGKSSDETGRALAAVAQMASKGTVAMEELRGQLGEALPGALQATAKALGITTQDLIQMISSGSVLAEDLLPALAKGLRDVYGTDKQVEGLTSEWTRFKNAISETFLVIGNSGVVSALSLGLRGLASTIELVILGFDGLGKLIGITLAGIANFDWKSPVASMKQWKEAYVEWYDELDKATLKAIGMSDKSTAAHKEQGAAVSEESKAYLALQAEQTKALTAAQKDVDLAGKNLAAKKQQADAMNALAQAFGDETEKMKVSAEAARMVADATQAAADAARNEAELRKAALAQMQAEISQHKEVSEAKQKALVDMKKQAEADEAAAVQAQAAADKARVQAEALETQAKAYGDNTARLGEYKAALAAAQEEEALAAARLASHSGTEKEAQQAREKLAVATRLYRDALADVVTKIDLAAAAEKRKSTLDLAALSVQKERLISELEIAKASGNERAAAEAATAIRDIDIKMLRAQASASRAAANEILLKVKALRAEYELTGKLTDVQKNELDRMIADAELKKLEADRSELLASRIRDVAEATDELRSRGAGSADGLSESLSSAANESDRLNESLRNRPGGTSPGGTAPGTVKKDVSFGTIDWREKALSMGLAGDQADSFAAVAGDYFQQQVQSKLDAYGGQMITSTRYANDFGAAIELAMQQAYAAVKPTTMSAPAASKTVRLELNINGKQIDVDTSESAAEKLVAELQAAAARS